MIKKITLLIGGMLLFLSVTITAQVFTEQTGISLTGVEGGSVAWGDYDNDGDLDILLTGEDSNFDPVSKIYRNNGNGTFTEQTGISLARVTDGSVAWGDYDNDGDLDILLTGLDNSSFRVSKIYHNNGNGTFTEQVGISLTGVYLSSVAWGDYDNDGDLDILLTGEDSNFEDVSKIYGNNGNGTFTEQTSISITGIEHSSVTWGDYDNDGDLDILLAGSVDSNTDLSNIYRNNGDGTFTEQPCISLTGSGGSSVDWGDYDNDGDLDILITGFWGYDAKIFQNNGNGTFTENFNNWPFPLFKSNSAAWGDYDNDGDLDILITGIFNGRNNSMIYSNNGNGSFTQQLNISLTGVCYSSIAWGDYDNDGDLDILLTGRSNSGPVSKIFRNNAITPNNAPSVVTNLATSVLDTLVTFTWDKGTDSETASDGLSYNLYVYENATGDAATYTEAFKQPHAANGKRLVAKMGNIRWRSEGYTLNLPLMDYKWSIQAVDAGLKGGAFAAERSFDSRKEAVINWDNPADIVYGTALSATQLNATANIAGTFSYSHIVGSILGAGNAQELSVTFTPDDLTNYKIVNKSVWINVSKAPLTITADDKTKTYGDANPAFTLSYSGFMNGDTETGISTLPVITCSATAQSSTGNYTISLSGGLDNNYELSLVNGTLTIGKAILTVTADNKTKVYGSKTPELTFRYSGFIGTDNEDSLTIGSIATTLATDEGWAGNHEIMVEGGIDNNYEFEYHYGILTISKAPLTVAFDDKTKVYGAENPEFTYSFRGFLYNDEASDIDVLPTGTCSANAQSVPGDYHISLSGGSDNNYSLIFEKGTLTILKAPLTITADDKTKTYGDANPSFTLSYSGFMNGDTETGINTLPVITCNATAQSGIGDYTISLSGGSDDNYELSLVNGTLTVGKATLSVTADNKIREYRTINPVFTYSLSGFLNNDEASDIDILPTATCNATFFSAPGRYAINLSGGSDNNYVLKFVKGTLTIVMHLPATDDKTKTKDTITTNPFTSITEIEGIKAMVYPNPFTSHVIVSVEDLSVPTNCKVYSNTGTIVYSGMINEKESTITLDGLIPGMYLFQISNAKGQKCFNLIKTE